MKIETYSHCQGEQIVDGKMKKELTHLLSNLSFGIVKGCASDLREAILSPLTVLGWSNEHNIDADSRISLTSSRNNHSLCLQTGNMSRFYADLLKLQYVFVNRSAVAAFYILPSKKAAKVMGDNIAHFDRFKSELQLFQKIITIPILVMGIN